MNTQVAAQMYTVRDFMQTLPDIDASFQKVKAAGYQAVQLSGGGNVDVHAVRDLLDQHGLIPCATHIGFQSILEDVGQVIENHRVLGCPYIGLGSMPEEYRLDAEGYRAFARLMEPKARAMADAGFTFIYHNHHFEFRKLDGRIGMELLLEATDPSWFQFEIDTYWVQMGGGDVIDWIRRLAGRMDCIHFKDMVTSPDAYEPIMAEVGLGNMNWQGIIAACAQAGVKWHIVEQDVCRRDPFESLALSLGSLHRYGLR